MLSSVQMKTVLVRSLALAATHRLSRTAAVPCSISPATCRFLSLQTCPIDQGKIQQPLLNIMEQIDLLTASAMELNALLDTKILTSENLVEQYFEQIARHNKDGMELNAVITTASREQTLERARHLDQERQEQGPRGPLHGIPVLIKDVFFTASLDMPTTCGSFTLKGAKASKNAAVVDKLLSAGAIIIGKANLSELGNYKGAGLKPGWSALGGQAQSPYVRGGVTSDALPLGHSTPAGSSAGPAVGVAAGFAVLAIATESDGSLVQPGTRAALYALKGTLGSIPTDGVQPITPVFDCIGGQAKTPTDLASVMGILQDKDYSSSLRKSWENLKIGFVDPALWQPADFVVEPREDFRKQSDAAISAAAAKIKASGAKVTKNVPLITLPEVFKNGVDGIDDTDSFMGHDFRKNFDKFLAGFEESEVHTLAEFIEWNKDHANLELPPEAPSQQVLIDALNNNMTDETYADGLELMRQRSTSAILKSLAEHDVDVILGPADGRIASVAACAGYPVGSLPLGFADFNGRAFGMNIISTSGQEGKMLEVMSAWETTFPEGRLPPPMLVNWAPENHEAARM